MGREKKGRITESDIISASEIGQFHYCSVAWYLQKCGYEPKSPSLEIGIKKHKDLGLVINNSQAYMKKSRLIATVGYLLLIFAILIFSFEVIL